MEIDINKLDKEMIKSMMTDILSVWWPAHLPSRVIYEIVSVSEISPVPAVKNPQHQYVWTRGFRIDPIYRVRYSYIDKITIDYEDKIIDFIDVSNRYDPTWSNLDKYMSDLTNYLQASIQASERDDKIGGVLS